MRIGGTWWMGLLAVTAPACGPGRFGEDDPEGLVIAVDAPAIEGTFRRSGHHVRFEASSEAYERATVHLEVDGVDLDVVLDLADQVVEEDAHGGVFDLEDRAALLSLRDALGEERPEIADTFEGRLLVKTADRYGEVPMGVAFERSVRTFGPPPGVFAVVQGGCGGDGVTCLPGTSGTSWAVFEAGGVCNAESTPYGDSVCRGRCGAGCSWWDEDYTWDCLDHDVCLDYSSDCDDEFLDAADDWAATFAPLCWSGTSRSRPPLAEANPPAEDPAPVEDDTEPEPEPEPEPDGDAEPDDNAEPDGDAEPEPEGDPEDADAVVDLGGWRLIQTGAERAFTFPPEIMVEPGDVVLVVRNAERDEFEAYWGVTLDERVVFLNASASENGGEEWPTIDGGETFTVEDPDGATVDGATMSLDAHEQYRRDALCDDPALAGSWSVVPSAPGEATPGALPSPSGQSCGLTLLELSDGDGVDGDKYEFVALYLD